jgi:hypothetical protein
MKNVVLESILPVFKLFNTKQSANPESQHNTSVRVVAIILICSILFSVLFSVLSLSTPLLSAPKAVAQ